MYNWSVDEKAFKEADHEGYERWRIEQMINWGLGGEKLDEAKLRKYWDKLYLDPIKRWYVEFLLWPDKWQKTQEQKS